MIKRGWNGHNGLMEVLIMEKIIVDEFDKTYDISADIDIYNDTI